jgi:DNA-binding response OmpR family regulator
MTPKDTSPCIVFLRTIDDDPAVLGSLRMALEYECYDVLCAATGRAGLALFERVAPDILLLDIDMPDIDGLEVHWTLHASHIHTVVMMSLDTDS